MALEENTLLSSANGMMVFMDYENVSLGARNLDQNFDYRQLRHELDQRGRVLATFAYGDFTGAWYEYHRRALLESGVQQVQLARSSAKAQKNRADIRLAIDATEIALTRPGIDTFVIVSGDSDLSELGLTLRKLGKQVITAAYAHQASRLLQEVSDEFIDLTPAVETKPAVSCHRLDDSAGSEDAESTLIRIVADALDSLRQSGEDAGTDITPLHEISFRPAVA